MHMAPSAVSLEKIETLDAESGAVIGTLEGDALETMVRLNGGAKGTSLAAGGSGFVFMDVTLAKEATLPKALRHRLTISVAKAPGEPASGDHDPAPAPPEQLTFVTDPLSVGPAAVVNCATAQGFALGGGRRMLHALQLPSGRHAAAQRRGARGRALRHRFRAAER